MRALPADGIFRSVAAIEFCFLLALPCVATTTLEHQESFVFDACRLVSSVDRELIAGFSDYYGGHKDLVIHSVADGRLIRRIQQIEKKKHIERCAFDQRSTRVAAGAGDRVKIWDIATGARVFMEKVGKRIFAIGFIDDGSTVAVINEDGEFGTWDVGTGRRVLDENVWLTPEVRIREISDGVFLPAGHVLCAGYVWSGVMDTRTRLFGNRLTVGQRYGRVASDASGEWGAVALYSAWYREEPIDVHVYPTTGKLMGDDGKPRVKLIKDAVSTGIGAVAVSEGGDLVAVQGRYGELTVHVLDGEKPRQIASLPRSFEQIDSGAVTFTSVPGELLVRRTAGLLDRYVLRHASADSPVPVTVAPDRGASPDLPTRSGGPRTIEERLRELKSLFDSDLITSVEYERLKKEILDEL